MTSLLPPAAYNFRTLTPHDQAFVWEMLYQAIYVSPGQLPAPRSILDDPEISRYAAGWGMPGDLGFLASVDATPVGATWLRLFPPENPGYGFIEAGIPEITLAVLPEWRCQGIGSRLLDLLLAAADNVFPAVCLSVVAESAAVRLYLRKGFVTVRQDNNGLAMIRYAASHDRT